MKTKYFLQRKSILLVCFSFLFISVFAGPVGKEKAQLVAQNFLKSKYKASSNTNMLTNYEAIMDKSNSQCVMHVFKGTSSYIVIAADDRIYPVLAYSDESTFPAKGVVPPLDNWMEGLASDIKAVSMLKSTVSSKVSQAWETYSKDLKSTNNLKSTNAVSPILVTLWNQDNLYNYFCPAFPSGPGGHCYAGCVATSMSQAMRYFKYPAQGFGSHSYSHPAFGPISANFGTTTYDWENMPVGLGGASTVERDAIATLMFHCGVAVEMDYSPAGSGAQTFDVPPSLYNYFKYRRFVEYVQRSGYTDDVWRNKLVENLDMHYPIIYDGHPASGAGHAWMCDGYSTYDYFHFNWGWGGSGNAYFYLDNLNSGNGTFNYGQGAVLNIVPETSAYPLCGNKKYFANTYTFSDGSNTDPYWNNTNCQWLIKPDSISTTDILKLSFIEFKTEAGNDLLSVYDGTSTSDSLLGTFSGSTLPSTLISTKGAFLLVFVTNASVTDLGWKVKYDITHAVSVQENTAASQFKVYPNPAHDVLNVAGDFKSAGNVKYTISNIIGAEVIKSELNVTEGYQNKSIDISQLKGGVYMISVESQNGKSFSKFIVE
jgi:hypothetical protein